MFGFLSPTPWAAALALVVLGVLMVSRVHYPAQRGAALGISSVGWAVWLGGARFTRGRASNDVDPLKIC